MLSFIEHTGDDYSPFSSASDSEYMAADPAFLEEQPRATGQSTAKAKLSTIHRVVKKALHFINLFTKIALPSARKSLAQKIVRLVLGIAKQAVVILKIIKTAVSAFREQQAANWLRRAYAWGNFVQSFLVGAVSFTAFIYPKWRGGKEILSFTHLFCSGIKLGRNLTELTPSSPYHLLKISKTVLSIASSIFIIIGIFSGGIFFLPKVLALSLSIAAGTIGLVKSFYRQTALDELIMLV